MNQQQYLEEFKKVTDLMLAITTAKNQDYSWKDAVDAFANFKVVEEFWISVEHWFLTRMLDKIKRVSNLVNQEAAVADEKITDTLLDLANYSLLFLLYLRSKDEDKQQIQALAN